MTKDDVVISHWAIGPSYRKELKETLSKLPLSETWFNTIILTDYPSDFAEFYRKKNILAVLDIAEQRKHHTWSFELEKLAPATLDEATYSKEFTKLRDVNEKFSYSLHRFSLPWIAANGFSKFLILDSDVRFRNFRDDNFVESFIKMNFNSLPENCKTKLIPGHIVDAPAQYKLHDFLAELIEKQFSEIHIPRDFSGIRIGDGPIKLYNFDNSYEVLRYFDVWNFIIKTLAGEYRNLLFENNMVGPYVINDEVIISLLNKFLNLNQYHNAFAGLYIVHNAEKTRYFSLTHENYLPAHTLEEFLTINNLTLSDIDR